MTITLFNKADIADSFSSAAARYDRAAVLQREVGERLLQRLELMRIQPRTILDLGAGTGVFSQALADKYPDAKIISLDLAHGMLLQGKQSYKNPAQHHALRADAEAIPLQHESIDLIFSNLVLHWCPDVDLLLREIHRVLKPEGLLMLTTLGPNTLQELRQSWASVDDAVHVHPFIDMHHIGDALSQLHFSDPVMDREDIVMQYSDPKAVMQDLKTLGARNLHVARTKGLTGKHKLQQVMQAYETLRDEHGYVPASYEVVYAQAWKVAEKPTQGLGNDGVVHFPIEKLKINK